MENILDSLRGYKKQWEVENTRNFNEAELSALAEKATCVASNFGRSFCFFMPSKNQSVFIPCDSGDNTDIGDTVDVKNISLIRLKYLGEDPTILKNINPDRTTLRAKAGEAVMEATDFNNPFGIG